MGAVMPSSATDSFTVSWGKHVGAVDPAGGEYNPHVEFRKDELIELLTEHRIRKSKDGPYITRPMRAPGLRSDENAEPWALVPVDIDELQAAEVPALLRWCDESNLAGCLATTFSHRSDLPKVRLWLFASREILASEHGFVHKALASMVPFRLDPCMVKPSQPVFLPSCPALTKNDAFTRVMDGDPLDVDRLLESFQEEIREEQRRRADRLQGNVASGVRQPGGLIDYFNQTYPLASLLEKHNYKRKGTNRYCSPSSKSRRAAVVLYDHSVVSFHEPDHDPLAVRNKFGQAIVLDSFAAFCKLDHLDDFKAAFGSALKWARAQGWEESAVPSSSAAATRPALPPPVLFNALDLYSNLRPQDMLVEGMLDQGAVVIAAGDSNSGKTTILQLLSLQVAQGAPFGARQTKKGRVLWIAGEDMENAKYRTVAMCEEYGVDPAALGDSLLLLPQPVAILQPDSMLSLHDAIEQRCGAAAEFVLVVIDSKSVNWGGDDENSNDENAAFVAAIRKYLVDSFGRPAVVITHHLTKHREKEARSSRGASALINNIDHEWRFDMNQEARLSGMSPGSKVRMERWAEQRFLIKTVDLPKAKFPQLLNNFGEMPRVSIAEPVNQYNKSMKQLQVDAELIKLLLSFDRLSAQGNIPTLAQIAADLHWSDATGKNDYRKVKRMLDVAEKQKLVDKSDGKGYEMNDAGRAYAAQEIALGSDESFVEPDAENNNQ